MDLKADRLGPVIMGVDIKPPSETVAKRGTRRMEKSRNKKRGEGVRRGMDRYMGRETRSGKGAAAMAGGKRTGSHRKGDR